MRYSRYGGIRGVGWYCGVLYTGNGLGMVCGMADIVGCCILANVVAGKGWGVVCWQEVGCGRLARGGVW